MKILAVGDIHGGLKALTQLLERADPKQDDLVVFLGDYVDGWSQAPETIDYLIQYAREQRTVMLRGNHDALCLDWLKEGMERELWLRSGGQQTVDSYRGIGSETRSMHIAFLEGLEDYYLDAANRLYLHAGFTNPKGVEYEYFKPSFYWDRTLWETALSLDPALRPGDARFPKRLMRYTEIFIGHTPVTRLGFTAPHKAANVWNIDTGAAFRGPLTAMDSASGQYWQSDPVHLLYPGEQGRNPA